MKSLPNNGTVVCFTAMREARQSKKLSQNTAKGSRSGVETPPSPDYDPELLYPIHFAAMTYCALSASGEHQDVREELRDRIAAALESARDGGALDFGVEASASAQTVLNSMSMFDASTLAREGFDRQIEES